MANEDTTFMQADLATWYRFMNKICRFVVVLGLVCLLAPAAQGSIFVGNLSYNPSVVDSTDGLYVAGGEWPNQTLNLSWEVTDEDPSYPGFPFKYSYRLSISGGSADISHLIIEASSNFSAADYTGLTTGAIVDAIGWQQAGPQVGQGNPSMPENIYGIKFFPSPGTLDMQWSFYSSRRPVWGDFYAKCGAVGGIQNITYNYNNTGGTENGFLSPDSDPMGPASSGSLNYHLLVPDTVVPEPSSIALLTGIGLLVAGVAHRHNRRRHQRRP